MHTSDGTSLDDVNLEDRERGEMIQLRGTIA
jgi:hypothetical protein